MARLKWNCSFSVSQLQVAIIKARITIVNDEKAIAITVVRFMFIPNAVTSEVEALLD